MSQEFRQHYAGGSLIKKPGLGILLAVGTTVPTGGGYAPGYAHGYGRGYGRGYGLGYGWGDGNGDGDGWCGAA